MNTVTKSILQKTASLSTGNLGARLVASVLLGVVTVVILATPVAALAASSVVTTDEGVIPDACHSHWKWKHGSTVGIDTINWTEVEWTSNPCRNSIRARTVCESIFGSPPVHGPHYDAPKSNATAKVNVWVRSNCNRGDASVYGQMQWRRPGGLWSKWKTYWTNPWA